MTQRQLNIFDTVEDAEKIGISVGYYFGVVPKDAAAHIELEESETINFNGKPLILYRGKSFLESRKIDRLLDEYGEYQRSTYDYWHENDGNRVDSSRNVEQTMTPDELGRSFQHRLELIDQQFQSDSVDHDTAADLYDELFAELKTITDKDPNAINIDLLEGHHEQFREYLKSSGTKPVEIDKLFRPKLFQPSDRTKEQVLQELRNAKNLEELLVMLNRMDGTFSTEGKFLPTFEWASGHFHSDKFIVNNNELVLRSDSSIQSNIRMATNPRQRNLGKYELIAHFCYFADDGKNWKTDLSIVFDHYPDIDYPYGYRHPRVMKNRPTVESITFSDWSQVKKLPTDLADLSYLQSKDDMERILNLRSPYTRRWMNDIHNTSYQLLLFAPQLEQLYKAEFAFGKNIVNDSYFWSRSMTSEKEHQIRAFNMLCKNESRIKDIFQTDKVVYSTLKDEPNLMIWDSFRKMFKQGKMNANAVDLIYNRGFRTDQLKQLSSILGLEYEGKKVFTWEKLVNYLVRLDNYQAIETDEAIPLIRDTFNMSIQLGIEPNVDSDSLKREHDVLARTFRQQADKLRSERLQKGMESARLTNEMYNFSDGQYLIRAITDYDDLINEAKMQHNCVASYAESIARQRTKIYVMRSVDAPSQSLITVELANDNKTIRQKYLKYNQVIQDHEQNAFLKTWLEKIDECNKGNYKSINNMLGIEDNESSQTVNEPEEVIAENNSAAKRAESNLIVPNEKLVDLMFGNVTLSNAVQAMNVNVLYRSNSNESFYDPAEDTVYIAMDHIQNRFDYNGGLVQTIHATGAATRLNRNLNKWFGDDNYKYETMVTDRALHIIGVQLQEQDINVVDQLEYSTSYVSNELDLAAHPEINAKVEFLARQAIDYLALKADLITQAEFNNVYSTIEPTNERFVVGVNVRPNDDLEMPHAQQITHDRGIE